MKWTNKQESLDLEVLSIPVLRLEALQKVLPLVIACVFFWDRDLQDCLLVHPIGMHTLGPSLVLAESHL